MRRAQLPRRTGSNAVQQQPLNQRGSSSRYRTRRVPHPRAPNAGPKRNAPARRNACRLLRGPCVPSRQPSRCRPVRWARSNIRHAPRDNERLACAALTNHPTANDVRPLPATPCTGQLLRSTRSDFFRRLASCLSIAMIRPRADESVHDRAWHRDFRLG